jgi:hypothetical protein
MTYAKRKDNNHAEIENALKAASYVVENCSRFGAGFPDLMVGSKGKQPRLVLLEVKQEKGKYTDAEFEFTNKWAGYPVYVVRSKEAALTVMAAYDD